MKREKVFNEITHSSEKRKKLAKIEHGCVLVYIL